MATFSLGKHPHVELCDLLKHKEKTGDKPVFLRLRSTSVNESGRRRVSHSW